MLRDRPRAKLSVCVVVAPAQRRSFLVGDVRIEEIECNGVARQSGEHADITAMQLNEQRARGTRRHHHISPARGGTSSSSVNLKAAWTAGRLSRGTKLGSI